jgi:hypothetical protein
MIRIEGQNDSTLTPVGGLYKQEIMVKKKCLCSPYQKIKAEAESKKRN